MLVDRKPELLTLAAFLQLRIAHAAVVHEYECHVRSNSMAVNRLWFVFRAELGHTCFIRNHHVDQELGLASGCIYFIPCNHEVELHLTPDVSFISLHFNLDLFYGFDVFGGSDQCEEAQAPDLVREVQSLLDSEPDLPSLCRLNEIIFHYCSFWLGGGSVDLQGSIAAYRQYEDVLEFVRQAGDAATTVAQLADLHGMRRDVFSRMFARDMGLTPKQFLTEALMRKASRLLLEPGVPVKTVANELNFSSEYYFSRFFKKHSGRSPSDYRRNSELHRNERRPGSPLL